jgi:hypothetical protein
MWWSLKRRARTRAGSLRNSLDDGRWPRVHSGWTSPLKISRRKFSLSVSRQTEQTTGDWQHRVWKLLVYFSGENLATAMDFLNGSEIIFCIFFGGLESGHSIVSPFYDFWGMPGLEPRVLPDFTMKRRLVISCIYERGGRLGKRF